MHTSIIHIQIIRTHQKEKEFLGSTDMGKYICRVFLGSYWLGVMVIGRVSDDEAVRNFEQMIQQGYDAPDILLNLAIWYTKAERYKEAEELLLRATKKDSNHDACWYQLGCVRYYQGKYKKAIDALKKASAIKANDYHSMHFIGLCMFELGQKEEGIRITEKVTQIDPSFVYAWRSLGMMYHKVGRHEQSENAYMRAVAFEPDHEPTFSALKKIVEDSGREVTKIVADGEGILIIGKRNADGKLESHKVMTIPKKQSATYTPWKLVSSKTFPSGQKKPYTSGVTHPKENFTTTELTGPNVVKCPKCGFSFIPMTKLGGKVTCINCSYVFRRPS